MPGLHQEAGHHVYGLTGPRNDGAFLNAVRALEDADTGSLNVALNQWRRLPRD
jgi:hypothetical protein